MVGDLPRHANHCTPSRDVREVFSAQKPNEISNPVKDSVSAVNRKAAMHYNRQGNGGCNPRVGGPATQNITEEGDEQSNPPLLVLKQRFLTEVSVTTLRAPQGMASPYRTVWRAAYTATSRIPRKRMPLRWPKAEEVKMKFEWWFRARQRRTRRTGRASGRTGRRLEEARSFDVAVGDVGRVANVGEAGVGDEASGYYVPTALSAVESRELGEQRGGRSRKRASETKPTRPKTRNDGRKRTGFGYTRKKMSERGNGLTITGGVNCTHYDVLFALENAGDVVREGLELIAGSRSYTITWDQQDRSAMRGRSDGIGEERGIGDGIAERELVLLIGEEECESAEAGSEVEWAKLETEYDVTQMLGNEEAR
ncbi:hypothetical protein B0H13DRAFT_1911008 [Mycena leptocephala]|nr:hypothetical protein B0H13DRAFT_1911008 [Mycena leptocephala]